MSFKRICIFQLRFFCLAIFRQHEIKDNFNQVSLEVLSCSSSAMPSLRSDYLYLSCDYFSLSCLLRWNTRLRVPQKQIHTGKLLIFFPSCIPITWEALTTSLLYLICCEFSKHHQKPLWGPVHFRPWETAKCILPLHRLQEQNTMRYLEGKEIKILREG